MKGQAAAVFEGKLGALRSVTCSYSHSALLFFKWELTCLFK